MKDLINSFFIAAAVLLGVVTYCFLGIAYPAVAIIGMFILVWVVVHRIVTVWRD